MGGETNLDVLLASMRPVLQDGVFVFVTLPPGAAEPPDVDPVMVFREREGRTLILRETDAKRAGLTGVFPCRMITLDVHSALEAVGFLAAVLPALAASGMGVNPVSAFYHDHLFVPADRAEEALAILRRLVEGDLQSRQNRSSMSITGHS
jgi:hypothetical protein